MGDVSKAKLVVTGRVQGVFYRQSTKQVASSLGLVGFVRNQRDGTVFAEVVGPRAQVDRLIAWCQKGPPSARVEKVDVEWIEAPPEPEFWQFEIL